MDREDCGAKLKMNQTHECESRILSTETMLSDMFNVTGEEDISQEINDAVVHVVKKKIDNSDLPNKSFILQTGGKVRKIKIIC